MNQADRAKPLGRLDVPVVAAVTILTSVVYYAIQEFLWRVVEPFDSSHIINSTSTSPGLRWDALHFLAIAKRGYQHEQQVAFQPGWQAVLHILGMGTSPGAADDAILRGSVIVNSGVRLLANIYLYKLTKSLFDRRTALIASVLYAFPPAPAVLSAPYTETSYAMFIFCGLYLTTTRKYWLAALSFALATSVRATGVFTVVPLAYILLLPVLRDVKSLSLARLATRVLLTGVLSVIVVSPFVVFQGWTWMVFCTAGSTQPWCTKLLPSSYSFVQGEYWNIGLFRYWRPEQLPNFLLAAPVLCISLLGIHTHFTAGLATSNHGDQEGQVASDGRRPLGASPHLTPPPRALPARQDYRGGGHVRAKNGDMLSAIVVYQALMTALLLFASHTQIALRLAPTDPVLWWTLAASMGTSGSRRLKWFEKMWGWWVCLWGAASLVLWTGHYPPA